MGKVKLPSLAEFLIKLPDISTEDMGKTYLVDPSKWRFIFGTVKTEFSLKEALRLNPNLIRR